MCVCVAARRVDRLIYISNSVSSLAARIKIPNVVVATVTSVATNPTNQSEWPLFLHNSLLFAHQRDKRERQKKTTSIETESTTEIILKTTLRQLKYVVVVLFDVGTLCCTANGVHIPVKARPAQEIFCCFFFSFEYYF